MHHTAGTTRLRIGMRCGAVGIVKAIQSEILQFKFEVFLFFFRSCTVDVMRVSQSVEAVPDEYQFGSFYNPAVSGLDYPTVLMTPY